MLRVISIKFCVDNNGGLAKQYPCALHVALSKIWVKRTISHYFSLMYCSLIIYLNNTNQYISTLFEYYLINIYLLIVTIRAHDERKNILK